MANVPRAWAARPRRWFGRGGLDSSSLAAGYTSARKRVALETDKIDIATKSGWSIVTIRYLDLVEDPDEIRWLEALNIHS